MWDANKNFKNIHSLFLKVKVSRKTALLNKNPLKMAVEFSIMFTIFWINCFHSKKLYYQS